jgi:hypothetical protein
VETDKGQRGLDLCLDGVQLPMDPTEAAGLGTWNEFTDAHNTSNVPTAYLLLLEEFILSDVFVGAPKRPIQLND